MRYRLTDYSTPAVHPHKKVTVKGYVAQVEIALGAGIVGRHRHSFVPGDVVYDPLHYLLLLEKNPVALDQTAPLRGWKLDAIAASRAEARRLARGSLPWIYGDKLPPKPEVIFRRRVGAYSGRR